MSTLLLVVPGPLPGLDVCAELRNYHTQFERLLVQWLACRSGTLSRGAQALAACRSIFDQATQLQLLFITTGHAPAEERRQASGEVAKAASSFQQRVDDIKPALAELDVEGSYNTFAWVALRLDYMKEQSAEMVNHYRHSADQLYKSVFLDFLGKLAFHKIDPDHLADADVQAVARQSTFRERASRGQVPAARSWQPPPCAGHPEGGFGLGPPEALEQTARGTMDDHEALTICQRIFSDTPVLNVFTALMKTSNCVCMAADVGVSRKTHGSSLPVWRSQGLEPHMSARPPRSLGGVGAARAC